MRKKVIEFNIGLLIAENVVRKNSERLWSEAIVRASERGEPDVYVFTELLADAIRELAREEKPIIHFERHCTELAGMFRLYVTEGEAMAQGSAFGEGYIYQLARHVAREGLDRLGKGKQ